MDEIQTESPGSSKVTSIVFPAENSRSAMAAARREGSFRDAAHAVDSADRQPREFIFGPENHLIPAMIHDLLHAPAKLSPILLYGCPGGGKRFVAELVVALANQQSQTSKQQTAGGWIINAIELVADNGHAAIAPPTATVIALLNIEEAARKAAWQRELAARLDEWSAAGIAILATSHVHPAEIPRITPRLKTRLTSGLCVELRIPESPTRQAMLGSWAASDGLDFSADVIASLAEPEQTPNQLREAYGRLVSTANSQDTQEVSPAACGHDREEVPSKHPSLAAVARGVARHFRVTQKELRGPSRRKTITEARGVAMHLARTLCGKSYAEIGRYFDGRDHTTVLHHVRKVKRLASQSHETRTALRTIQDSIEANLQTERPLHGAKLVGSMAAEYT